MKFWIFNFSKYLSFPFIMGAFLSIRTTYVFEMQRGEGSINWKYQAIFLNWLMFLSEALSGSLYYCLYRNKKEVSLQQGETNVVPRNNFEMEKVLNPVMPKRKIPLFLLALSTVLDFAHFPGSFCVASFIGEASQTTFALKSFQIISTGLLCYFILGVRIHRHHIVAICVIIIGISLITGSYIIDEINSVAHVISLIILIFIASLQETLDKYIMDLKQVQPLELLVYQGVIGMLLTAILIIILSFVPCPQSFDTFICDFKNQKKFQEIPEFFSKVGGYEVIFLIVYMISSGGFNVFLRYTIYYLNPTNRTTGETFSTLVLWIYIKALKIDSQSAGILIATIAGYIILIFGCLFYNEVITFRCFHLNFNTRNEISRRSKIETVLATRFELMNEEEF